MKMGAGLLWGIIFILIGLVIILKVVFKIDFPIFKVLLSLLFIYIGIRILLGDCMSFKGCYKDKHTNVFGSSIINDIDQLNKEFNTVFGNTILDLTTVELKPDSNKLKINTVFGSTEVRINKETPVKIKANSAFGSVKMPDKNTVSFGTANYNTEGLKEEENYLLLDVNVVFGEIELKVE